MWFSKASGVFGVSIRREFVIGGSLKGGRGGGFRENICMWALADGVNIDEFMTLLMGDGQGLSTSSERACSL